MEGGNGGRDWRGGGDVSQEVFGLLNPKNELMNCGMRKRRGESGFALAIHIIVTSRCN